MTSINEQTNSLLFTLPGEIRMNIWTLALAPTEPHRSWHRQWLANHNFRVRPDHEEDPGDRDWEEQSDWKELQGPPTSIYPGAFRCSFRPDLDGRPILQTQLLGTCRRIRQEAGHLIFKNERCFRSLSLHYGSREDSLYRVPYWYCTKEDLNLYHWTRARRRWERQFTRIRLVGPIDNMYDNMHAEQQLLRKIEHLRITVRVADWDRTMRDGHVDRQGASLQINALGSPRNEFFRVQHSFMHDMMEATKDFNLSGASTDTCTPDDIKHAIQPHKWVWSWKRPRWAPPEANFTQNRTGCQPNWAREFINMPRLKTFAMDFDAPEHRRDELAKIVEWAARAWRMPLNPNHAGYHYLSADGNPVSKTSWRGTIHDWPSTCSVCSQYFCSNARLECEEHERVWGLFRKGYGPRICSWTVTWTPRRSNGPEVYPYDRDSSFLTTGLDHDVQDDDDESIVFSDDDQEDEV
ncbi:hypothetical protein MAPG_10164 [Magnaporthiopsis poae ATCC 64411]|uniref:Uncharacterized protein n=1 Tax=Magnaporthiopsis poae (strain ATCC 64411 / 73-15) TaxID=644358 RepID=A0A0C4EBV5_MAGP6|nr:hypothetical protein MAPG_10164 [Magnaporthiopsis poae ATCC 64411]